MNGQLREFSCLEDPLQLLLSASIFGYSTQKIVESGFHGHVSNPAIHLNKMSTPGNMHAKYARKSWPDTDHNKLYLYIVIVSAKILITTITILPRTMRATA